MSNASVPTVYSLRRFLYEECRNSPREAIELLCLLLLAAGLAVVGPRLLGLAIDSALTPKNFNALAYIAAIFLATEILRLVAGTRQTFLLALLGQNFMRNLRTRIDRHLLAVPLASLERHPSGDLTARVTSDVATLGLVFTTAFIQIINQLVTAIIFGIAIVLTGGTFGLLALAFFPVFLVIAAIAARSMYRLQIRIRKANGALVEEFVDSLTALDEIQAFNRQNAEGATLNAQSAELARLQSQSARMFAVLHASMTLVIGGTVTVLLINGAHRISAGTLQPGILVSILTYLLWLFWPVLQVVNQSTVFLAGKAAANRVFEILSLPGEQNSRTSAPSMPLTGKIEFKAVAYEYGVQGQGIRNISLHIAPGERLGVVGLSGSGKSTFVKLLLGLYAPERGSIAVDGIDTAAIPPCELRRRIGCMQQDPFLFRLSLEENISMLAPVTNAIELPPPLHQGTIANLSRGGRQLVALQRVLHHMPDIFVLDEATAALDPEQRATIMDLFWKIARGKTTIVVSHALTAVEQLDRIAVFHHGEIVQLGSPQALLRDKDGLFRKLYELQRIESGAG